MKKKILVISIILFCLDQIIKTLAFNYLTSINIIPGVLSLIYAKNEGVAFSLLSGSRIFIILISFVLIFILIYFLYKDYICKNKYNNLTIVSYGLLFGGIFGNLFDRILRGYVIDYISLNIFGYSFPIFNLADIFITVGVILMIIDMIVSTKNSKE